MLVQNRRLGIANSAFLLSLFALAGCNQPNATATANGGGFNPEIQAEVEQSIAQSAAEASNALETLAMVQRTRTPPTAPIVDDSGMPPELKRQATVGFTGPSVELAKEMAQDIGYAFTIEGPEPKTPGIISIDAKDEPVFRVFEDVGLQSASFATVIVDPNQKRVLFRYASPHNVFASNQPPEAPKVSPPKTTAPKPHPVRHVVKIKPLCPCQSQPAVAGAKTTTPSATSPSATTTSATGTLAPAKPQQSAQTPKPSDKNGGAPQSIIAIAPSATATTNHNTLNDVPAAFVPVDSTAPALTPPQNILPIAGHGE